jgi:hypothetical protein
VDDILERHGLSALEMGIDTDLELSEADEAWLKTAKEHVARKYGRENVNTGGCGSGCPFKKKSDAKESFSEENTNKGEAEDNTNKGEAEEEYGEEEYIPEGTPELSIVGGKHILPKAKSREWNKSNTREDNRDDNKDDNRNDNDGTWDDDSSYGKRASTGAANSHDNSRDNSVTLPTARRALLNRDTGGDSISSVHTSQRVLTDRSEGVQQKTNLGTQKTVKTPKTSGRVSDVTRVDAETGTETDEEPRFLQLGSLTHTYSRAGLGDRSEDRSSDPVISGDAQARLVPIHEEVDTSGGLAEVAEVKGTKRTEGFARIGAGKVGEGRGKERGTIGATAGAQARGIVDKIMDKATQKPPKGPAEGDFDKEVATLTPKVWLMPKVPMVLPWISKFMGCYAHLAPKFGT